MEATVKERRFESQLNQGRQKVKPKGASTFSPEFIISMAEMLLMLGAALTIDIIDVLDLTVFGAILVRFIDIPAALAIWLWLKSKHEITTPLKNPGFKIVFAFLIEISPFGMLPMWTLFIIYVWLKQGKAGRQILAKGTREIRIKKR